MNTHDIREKYLSFFKTKKHEIIASSSLVPENDPTTLFTGSGMQPMVPYLLGGDHPKGVRIVDSQKCFRSQDIEEVGDNRHTTFFEMLGNWSLGDYFKEEQITWMFEFLTQELKIDPNRLYVSVFRGNDQIPKDSESVEIWKRLFLGAGIEAPDVDFSEMNGMQGGRIFYYSEKKNWWSRSGVPDNMPIGEPGGPDSEMFFDFGESLGLHEVSAFKDVPCHVNCDCGRFMEIGNNVFMEYKKTSEGFEKLPKSNVDFGGGLERMAAAVNDNPDVFLISVFASAKKELELLSGKKYEENSEMTKATRVILDHLRAAVFLICDGVVPSNKDQGYFVRRLVRRAVRFGKKISIQQSFVEGVGRTFVQEYQGVYPALSEQCSQICSELSAEEGKFNKTLHKGEKEFEKMFNAKNSISGEDAFILYSTYGFPIELTEEMAQERGQVVDRETFVREFKKHQDLSRAGADQKFSGGLSDHSDETIKLHTATHLLQKALRIVLGEHVFQKGSNIQPERLRFDFSHPEKMTPDQIQQVENIVNEQIQADLIVSFENMTFDEARVKGAIGIFQDKYKKLGDKIKVYSMVGQKDGQVFSLEVCGGPHVEHTGALGHFRILKEESVSNGVRRIKAVLEKVS